MIRRMVLLCAGCIALVVSNCSPPQQSSLAVAQSCDISSMIQELTPGFSPVDYGNCTSGAACLFNDPTTYVSVSPSKNFPAEQAAIVAAYNISPAFFKNALCSLHAIYVNTDTDQTKPAAWGMRERRFPNGSGGYRQHIGISAGLLAALSDGTQYPVPYADYERN
jgi:hypothetical protein